MRRLNERSALARTIKQLGAKDPSAIRYAYGLVVETTRRKNLIDKLVNNVVDPKKIGEYDLGIQSFLRLYVYQTRVVKNWGKYNLKEADSIASLGRAILGWEAMREIEPYLGFLLTRQLSTIMETTSEAEKVGLETYPSNMVCRVLLQTLRQRRSNRILERQPQPATNLHPPKHFSGDRRRNPL